ncbi:hypothetical protein ES707_10947 [subsurface metagenome]
MEESKKRLYLSIASTLAWIWGIIMLFNAIVFGIPAISMGKNFGFPLLMLVIGGLYCFSGYGLRKKRRIAGVVALVVSGLVLILNIISPARVSPLTILVNLAIIILVLINWKELA